MAVGKDVEHGLVGGSRCKALGLCFLLMNDVEKVASSRTSLSKGRDIESGVQNAN
jgi:hypothetical protein